MNGRYKRLLTRLLVFGILTVLLSQRYVIAQNQPACASIATPGSLLWNVTVSNGTTIAGYLQVQQDADGTINGTYTEASGQYCQDPFEISGSSQGNGEFSITGQDEVSPPGQYCTNEFDGTQTISVSGAGCEQGTFVWSNVSGRSGTSTMTLNNGQGVLATAENTPAFQGWETDDPAVGDFWQDIVPTDYNFVGRTVTETFPSNNLVDHCDQNPGSPPIAGVATVTIYPTQLESNGITTGYGDRIGFETNSDPIDKIREVGDAPCTISRQQDMSIDTATVGDQYQVNTLLYEIGTNTLAVGRGPVGNPVVSTPRYFPTLALIVPSAIIGASMLTLLASIQ